MNIIKFSESVDRIVTKESARDASTSKDIIIQIVENIKINSLIKLKRDVNTPLTWLIKVFELN